MEESEGLYSLAEKHFTWTQILDVPKDCLYCEAETEHPSKGYE